MGALVALIAIVFFALNALEPRTHNEGAPETPQVEATAPTDTVKAGYLTFDTPGLQQDTPYLVYEEPGKPALTARLIMDAMSSCSAGQGATPCIAMSVQWSTVFGGKRAIVEGNAAEDGSILVRKLRIIAEGEPVLLNEPGRSFMSWPHAVSLIESCSVAMVMQTHALDVQLTLKDGRELVAVEPVIDEVFQVVQRSTPACGQIPVATE